MTYVVSYDLVGRNLGTCDPDLTRFFRIAADAHVKFATE